MKAKPRLYYIAGGNFFLFLCRFVLIIQSFYIYGNFNNVIFIFYEIHDYECQFTVVSNHFPVGKKIISFEVKWKRNVVQTWKEKLNSIKDEKHENNFQSIWYDDKKSGPTTEQYTSWNTQINHQLFLF